MCLKGGSAPKPVSPPPLPAAAPKKVSDDVLAARDRQDELLRKKKGLKSAIKTGGTGLAGQLAATTEEALLGGGK